MTTVAALVAGTFVHQVLSAAHQSRSTRASLNRTFGVMVHSTFGRANQLDRDTQNLLNRATSMTRTAFVNRYRDLDAIASDIAHKGEQLAHPALSGDINVIASEVIVERIKDWRVLRAGVEGPLRVDGQITPTSAQVSSALYDLGQLNSEWRVHRHALRHEPGRVKLRPSVWGLASWTPGQLSRITHLSNLRPTTGVSIVAVLIDPQPMPVSGSRLVLLPSADTTIGVTVRNSGGVNELIHVAAAIHWNRGAKDRREASRLVEPLTDSAVVFGHFPLTPGASGSLIITASGGPSTGVRTVQRTYRIRVAPAST